MNYKAPDNSLHFVAPEYAYMLPAGCVQITSAEAEEIRIANMPPQSVPQRITMRQARLALLGAGLLAAVNVGITGMSQAAQIEWEYAATVERTNPLIAALASALALTPGQVDALFVAGAAL
tara:strand:- start:2383 stop:2745 length:363 start_codon:yes stop_codon:yes gene_type:complete